MTGALCRIGSALKKSDPNIKVSYMPGLPLTFVYKTPSGTTWGSVGAYCKKADDVAAEVKAGC